MSVSQFATVTSLAPGMMSFEFPPVRKQQFRPSAIRCAEGKAAPT